MSPASLTRSRRRPRRSRAIATLLIAGALPAALRAEEAGPTPEAIAVGRELFTHSWMPGDPRSRGGDGLGPVFNAQSCADCHDRGGLGGGGLSARNIEIASVPAGFGPVGFGGDGAPGFFYAIRMDFGAGRFEYRIGTPAAAPARGDAARARDRARPAVPEAQLRAMEAIHPGFRESPSVVLHRFGTDPTYGDWRAGLAGLQRGAVGVRLSQRNPTPLFGVGLIDAIPDDAIEAAARASARARATRGRVPRLADGRIGRFGWKGQTATLEEFVLSAAAGEIGLEVPGHSQAVDPRLPGIGAPGPDLDRGDCDALTAFVRSLPRPVVDIDDEQASRVEAGAATFRSIGCTACHVPDLGGVEGLYSDLLLHDMGPRLVDTGSYIAFGARPAAPAPAAAATSPATDNEWRTPPLWGLRDSAPYLHDGRAATIAEAILQHDGQGAPAARRFAQLPGRRREQLEAFLRSLAAPTGEGEGHRGELAR